MTSGRLDAYPPHRQELLLSPGGVVAGLRILRSILLRAGLAIVVPLTTLGLVAALMSLGVVANFRGWTRSLADHGQRLSRRGGIRGSLFRGQYSGLMIRVMALQAAAVALMSPAATLAYAADGPKDSLAVPIVTYLVAFLAAIVLVVSTGSAGASSEWTRPSLVSSCSPSSSRGA